MRPQTTKRRPQARLWVSKSERTHKKTQRLKKSKSLLVTKISNELLIMTLHCVGFCFPESEKVKLWYRPPKWGMQTPFPYISDFHNPDAEPVPSSL